MKIDKFDTGNGLSDQWMTSSDEQLHVSLNMPDALKSIGDEDCEKKHSLPPYRARRAFLTDKYPACQNQNWPKSEGILTSYFVPVISGKGMWLDFNKMNTLYDSAIVISIQGVNAITGLETKEVNLEQYKKKCPKHGTKFGPHRFCEKCGYKWPKQNYICSTGQPLGQLWIDGFRAADGFVRQYILSEEKMKGVAQNIIGERKTVYAIGLSFFLSKSQKPKHPSGNILRSLSSQETISPGNISLYGASSKSSQWENISTKPTPWASTLDVNCSCSSHTKSLNSSVSASNCSHFTKGKVSFNTKVTLDNLDSISLDNKTVQGSAKNSSKAKTTPAKKLEVGAGAKIKQKIYDDPNDLDFWREKPESIIIINYCTEDLARNIIEAGEADITGSSEGFLKEVPVGN